MKTTFYYCANFGLAGCYLPDSQSYPYAGTTRKELAEYIRCELDIYDLPKSLFNEVKISRLWSFIKRNGSSTAHFNLHHKQYCLSFNGLTEEEFAQLENQE